MALLPTARILTFPFPPQGGNLSALLPWHLPMAPFPLSKFPTGELPPWLCSPHQRIPTAPIPSRGQPQLCPSPAPPHPTYCCIVVEADVGAFPVAGSVHQLTLVGVPRGGFAGQGNHQEQGSGACRAPPAPLASSLYPCQTLQVLAPLPVPRSPTPLPPHPSGMQLRHQRIPLTSACSSLTDSHWLQRGLSATTKSRLVLASLCAWKSLGVQRQWDPTYPVPQTPPAASASPAGVWGSGEAETTASPQTKFPDCPCPPCPQLHPCP